MKIHVDLTLWSKEFRNDTEYPKYYTAPTEHRGTKTTTTTTAHVRTTTTTDEEAATTTTQVSADVTVTTDAVNNLLL